MYEILIQRKMLEDMEQICGFKYILKEHETVFQ